MLTQLSVKISFGSNLALVEVLGTKEYVDSFHTTLIDSHSKVTGYEVLVTGRAETVCEEEKLIIIHQENKRYDVPNEDNFLNVISAIFANLKALSVPQ